MDVLRWTMAAVVVVASHGVGAWAALNWHTVDTIPSDPPPAVQIDLAPLATAPDVPLQEVAPGQQMAEAQPEVTPDTQTPLDQTPPDPTPPTPVETVEPIKPDPAPVEQTQAVHDAKPEIMPPVPPPEVPIPSLPEKDNAEAVLAPPPPRPKAHRKPPPRKHEAERRRPVDPVKPRQRQTSAPPTAPAQRSDTAAAPTAGSDASPSVTPAAWKSMLNAYLNKYKRPVPGAGPGTASIAFTITRSGQVLSARLIGSSGNTALDAEALSLPRRASPVPAPPQNIGGGASLTLSVPIHFDR